MKNKVYTRALKFIRQNGVEHEIDIGKATHLLGRLIEEGEIVDANDIKKYLEEQGAPGMAQTLHDIYKVLIAYKKPKYRWEEAFIQQEILKEKG